MVAVLVIFIYYTGFDEVECNLNILNVFDVLQVRLVGRNVPLLYTYYIPIRTVSVIVATKQLIFGIFHNFDCGYIFM